MNRFLLLAVASLACGACESNRAADPLTRGREVYDLCAQCHGEAGQGNESLGAPAIAGQHGWYVAAQLRKFKSGIRGAHPKDGAGLRMRPMALSLKNDADIDAVSAYVEKLPPAPTPVTLTQGRAETGAALFGACATCHGTRGEGNVEKRAPALVRTDDWYLLAQLKKFKSGVRGFSDEDVEAAQMLPWVGTLADEQAMKDVLAHVDTLR